MAERMAEDSAVFAERFRCLHDAALAARASEEPYLRILRIGNEESDALGAFASVLKDAEAVELKTAGGGACAIHAAFGDRLRIGDCHVAHTQPRQLLRQILLRPLDVVASELSEKGEDLLRSVLTSTWMEFVVPNITAAGTFRPLTNVVGAEARHFLRGLLLPQHQELREAIEAQVRANTNLGGERDILMAWCRVETSKVFRQDFEQSLWRRLGVEAGVLPATVSDPIRMSAAEVGEIRAATPENVGGTCDFLETP